VGNRGLVFSVEIGRDADIKPRSEATAINRDGADDTTAVGAIAAHRAGKHWPRRQLLPQAHQLAAEVVVPKGESASATLAVFLALDEAETTGGPATATEKARRQLRIKTQALLRPAQRLFSPLSAAQSCSCLVQSCTATARILTNNLGQIRPALRSENGNGF